MTDFSGATIQSQPPDVLGFELHLARSLLCRAGFTVRLQATGANWRTDRPRRAKAPDAPGAVDPRTRWGEWRVVRQAVDGETVQLMCAREWLGST